MFKKITIFSMVGLFSLSGVAIAQSSQQDDNLRFDKDSTTTEPLLNWHYVKVKPEEFSYGYETLDCPTDFPIGYLQQIREIREIYNIEGVFLEYEYGPWEEHERTCRAARVEYRNLECPVNQRGEHVQARNYEEYQNGGRTNEGDWYTTNYTCDYYWQYNDSETRTLNCPAGSVGSITETRTYEVWSNGIRNDSGWYQTSYNCREYLSGPLNIPVLATETSSVGGANPCTNSSTLCYGLPSEVERTLQRGNGTAVGLTINPQTQQLMCAVKVDTTSGSGEGPIGVKYSFVLGDARSYNIAYSGPGGDYGGGGNALSCTITNGGKSAKLFGNCSRTEGGDGDGCVSGSSAAQITNVDGCTVTVRAGASRNNPDTVDVVTDPSNYYYFNICH